MLYINDIQKILSCSPVYAEEVFNNISGLGFDFSGSTEEEFHAIVVEVFQLMESGVLS